MRSLFIRRFSVAFYKCFQIPAGCLAIIFLLSSACGLKLPSESTGNPGPDAAAAPARFALPSCPQPQNPESLKPGLAAVYFNDFSARHLDALPEYNPAKPRGTKGAPITDLNRHFGYGPVFTSGASQEIGMRAMGWIHLDQAGEYAFHVLSNDGVRVFLNNQKILDDPTQHSDQLAGPVFVQVQNPGWYPLRLDYFQRKGTATLVLSWQPPGSGRFTPVPPEALAHDDI